MCMRVNLRLTETTKDVFENFERLDMFSMDLQVTLPQNVQVMKTLEFCIDERTMNPRQKLNYVFRSLRYVQ